MVGEPVADAAIALAVLLFSALISTIEAAFQSVSRHQLEQRAAHAGVRVSVALKLKNQAEMLRAATKVVVIFTLVFSALLLAPYIQILVDVILEAAHAGNAALAFGYHAVLMVLFAALLSSGYLVVVSLVARSYGRRHALGLSVRAAPMMAYVVRIASIPARAIIGTAKLLSPKSGAGVSFIDSIVSEEGIKDMLEEGSRSGLIDSTERELIESIFDFTTTTAREIMIPRTEIIAIELGMSADEILRVVVEEGFTRMPVYKESIDNIVGIVYAKDVLSLIQHSALIILEDIIRPPNYVPESKPIPELLRDFQRRHQHLAIVVDEFGGTEGLITMEDILEEIVGEIQDEYDEEELLVEYLGDGTAVVQAKLNISEFNEVADFNLPESEDYDTVGGFVTALFGRIPGEREEVRFHDIHIHVMRVEERRIVTVWMKRMLPEDDSETDD